MYSTEGIVLKKTDAGEADALFTLYTRDFGKIRALARGVKKEGAKLRGHLEALNFASISFVLGKNGERLTHAVLRDPWPGIRSDLEKLKAASGMAGFMDEHCFPGEKDERVWRALITHFMMLEKIPQAEDGFFDSFEVEIQKCLGYSEFRVDANSHIRRFV